MMSSFGLSFQSLVGSGRRDGRGAFLAHSLGGGGDGGCVGEERREGAEVEPELLAVPGTPFFGGRECFSFFQG